MTQQNDLHAAELMKLADEAIHAYAGWLAEFITINEPPNHPSILNELNEKKDAARRKLETALSALPAGGEPAAADVLQFRVIEGGSLYGGWQNTDEDGLACARAQPDVYETRILYATPQPAIPQGAVEDAIRAARNSAFEAAAIEAEHTGRYAVATRIRAMKVDISPAPEAREAAEKAAQEGARVDASACTEEQESAEYLRWNLPGNDAALAFHKLDTNAQVRQAFIDGLRRGRALGVALPSQAALDSPRIDMPPGLTDEEKRQFILKAAAGVLVCQACAGDAPGGKCKNPRCIGGPIVMEIPAGMALPDGGRDV